MKKIRILVIMIMISLALVACGETEEKVAELSDVRVEKLSLFQVIESEVYNSKDKEIQNRTIPMVADRDVKATLFVEVPKGFSDDVKVEIEVVNGSKVEVIDYDYNLTVNSDADDPKTAINIDIPKEMVKVGAEFKVTLTEKTTMKEVTYPNTGYYDMKVVETAPIKIQFIPYEINGFTPDTSKKVIDGYKEAIMALYPTSDVVITVGDVVHYDNSSMGDILVDVGIQQERYNLGKDVYFYGLVTGVATRDEFKGSTGTSEEGGEIPERAYFACGAAFKDERSESTLLHELGHLHKLKHSPGGNPPDIDPLYPYSDGQTHIFGYDYRTDEFVTKEAYDLMGYSLPRWVSEYNYLKLIDHILLSKTWNE